MGFSDRQSLAGLIGELACTGSGSLAIVNVNTECTEAQKKKETEDVHSIQYMEHIQVTGVTGPWIRMLRAEYGT